MNATAPLFAAPISVAAADRPISLVDAPQIARAAPPGLVLPFRRRVSAEQMTNDTSLPDDHVALIMAIAQRRDRAAFAALFRYFAPRVKAWMMRGGASATIAEEMAQETMLIVWQKAALFDAARAGPATWIFTIARNQRIDALRRERHPSTLMPDPVDEPEPQVSADHVLTLAQQEGRIRDALGTLPAEQAEVIRKAFFEDKVHADIEKELGIPLGTVKSRIRLAMSRLRSALGDLT